MKTKHLAFTWNKEVRKNEIDSILLEWVNRIVTTFSQNIISKWSERKSWSAPWRRSKAKGGSVLSTLAFLVTQVTAAATWWAAFWWQFTIANEREGLAAFCMLASLSIASNGPAITTTAQTRETDRKIKVEYSRASKLRHVWPAQL